jgi:hypothetical protein
MPKPSESRAMKPEVFDWPCGRCETATPHHRYPAGPNQPPTQCSVCGEQPFAMSEIGKDSDAQTSLTGWKILSYAGWAVAAFFIGFLFLNTNPKLAWLKDLLMN